MANQGVCLAAKEGFGQIYDCGSCGNVHVQVGPVTITLDPEAYMQFVDLVSTSAANFEVWLQLKRGETPECWSNNENSAECAKEGEFKKDELS